MRSTREINRLLIGTLAGFAIIAIAAAYWAIFGIDTILTREDNPRLFEAEASILRGDIVDRTDRVVATSAMEADGSVSRNYAYPETSSALGYYSLQYGAGGAEAAYNGLLRGDDRDFTSELLHRPQVGTDIKLTLDLGIQQQIAQALNGRVGAVVVIGVPGGETLGLVSLPTYNPNTLDADWEMLIEAPGKPFFNRALQANYQPGGTLQTLLMAAALLNRQPLETVIENATDTVQLADVDVTCAVRLPEMALTLRDAYAFACPKPFEELAETLDWEKIQDTFVTFQLNRPPILEGFVPQPATQASLTSFPLITTENLVENALGQGNLTVTPLQMAVMAAAIINDGNAPQPYTLAATRAPESDTWIPVEAIRPTIPYANANTARQLQDLMRSAVANGAAFNAARLNIDIGGHATIAYSGDETQAWFVGFATIAGRQAVAVAVVLENSNDPGLAADIGGSALAAAHEALRQN
jgi:penicillin-binding protein A